MYLTQSRRKHLDNPRSHIVTAADLQYLLTRAILAHDRQETHLNESFAEIVLRFLGKSDRRDISPEQLTIGLGSILVVKVEYERRRHWHQSETKDFIIAWLDEYIDYFYAAFFGIKFEGDMQRNGDFYEEEK